MHKALKINSKDEYVSALNTGLCIKNKLFVCFVKKNSTADTQAKMGVIVSKRNVPLAVKRNVIKRVTRASFRSNLQKLSDTSIVLKARRSIVKQSKKSIANELQKVWHAASQV